MGADAVDGLWKGLGLGVSRPGVRRWGSHNQVLHTSEEGVEGVSYRSWLYRDQECSFCWEVSL